MEVVGLLEPGLMMMGGLSMARLLLLPMLVVVEVGVMVSCKACACWDARRLQEFIIIDKQSEKLTTLHGS